MLAAVIVLGLGALFLLFVLLTSQSVSSHSCETLLELLTDPEIKRTNKEEHLGSRCSNEKRWQVALGCKAQGQCGDAIVFFVIHMLQMNEKILMQSTLS